jgi:hypothetical protein
MSSSRANVRSMCRLLNLTGGSAGNRATSVAVFALEFLTPFGKRSSVSSRPPPKDTSRSPRVEFRILPGGGLLRLPAPCLSVNRGICHLHALTPTSVSSSCPFAALSDYLK